MVLPGACYQHVAIHFLHKLAAMQGGQSLGRFCSEAWTCAIPSCNPCEDAQAAGHASLQPSALDACCISICTYTEALSFLLMSMLTRELS